MFENLRRNPIMIVVTIALIIIIIIGVFTPRNNRLTAGFNLGGHIGSLKGEFNIETLQNMPSMVLFHAPWCGHCKNFMPIWDQLSKSDTGNIDIVKVNCDENKELAKKHGIQGFPTVKFLPQGILNTMPDQAQAYEGARTHQSLMDFIKTKL